MKTKHLTIFEGCDGTGKTTAAKAYAHMTGARYVHLGPFPRLTAHLARMYAEAMLPALLGLQSVVMDRSWLSELPYGKAFRDGSDRLGVVSCRMLERLAMRSGAVVVKCHRPYHEVLKSFNARKGREYLASDTQLKQVYDFYDEHLETNLPLLMYDYGHTEIEKLAHDVAHMRMLCHEAEVATVGNYAADITLVGESFANVTQYDTYHQWPFIAYGGGGCSRWFTAELERAGIGESNLFWVNADQLELLHPTVLQQKSTIMALGQSARRALDRLNLSYDPMRHPQHHRRFGFGGDGQRTPYELIDAIKSVLRERREIEVRA